MALSHSLSSDLVYDALTSLDDILDEWFSVGHQDFEQFKARHEFQVRRAFDAIGEAFDDENQEALSALETEARSNEKIAYQSPRNFEVFMGLSELYRALKHGYPPKEATDWFWTVLAAMPLARLREIAVAAEPHLLWDG
jgi:hypothetical protein